MSRVLGLQSELEQIGTIKDLTSVFEAIASIHISQIKDKVVSSTKFFNELWGIYSQIRDIEKTEIGSKAGAKNKRPALLAITSSGGLIGDIDEKIIHSMMQDSRLKDADVYLVGGHGVSLLAQNGLKAKQEFALPEVEQGASVASIAKQISHYRRATVYYQTYVSLSRQEVAQLDLFSAVAALGKDQTAQGEVISERDYIFEPSLESIIAYMESVMLEIALGQVVLESKLAQYASRFNAMSAAKQKANDMSGDLKMRVNRAKRSVADERTKEIMSAMKLMGGGNG
jgi:F-type H+-transporting ATPase subunit gamma